jgi:hypothetical protein
VSRCWAWSRLLQACWHARQQGASKESARHALLHAPSQIGTSTGPCLVSIREVAGVVDGMQAVSDGRRADVCSAGQWRVRGCGLASMRQQEWPAVKWPAVECTACWGVGREGAAGSNLGGLAKLTLCADCSNEHCGGRNFAVIWIV